MKSEHTEQCSLPLGWSWYLNCFFEPFAKASVVEPSARAASAGRTMTRRRASLRLITSSVLCLRPSRAFLQEVHRKISTVAGDLRFAQADPALRSDQVEIVPPLPVARPLRFEERFGCEPRVERVEGGILSR